jgi:hypothetical protein
LLLLLLEDCEVCGGTCLLLLLLLAVCAVYGLL